MLNEYFCYLSESVSCHFASFRGHPGGIATILLLLLFFLNFITDSLLHTSAGKYDSWPNYKDYNKDTTLVF